MGLKLISNKNKNMEVVNRKIVSNLLYNRAVRIGETAVVSRNVHYVDNRMPEEIKILTRSDAGKVFYNRINQGEVIHIDIFHEIGIIDHISLASKLIAKLSDSPIPTNRDFNYLDLIDIQTASGGGRLTGSLNYGQRDTIKKAHLSHVHITVKYEIDIVDLLLFLIEIVEEEIMYQGKEIRKIERIKHINNKRGRKMDLSPYTGDSDSMLKNETPNEQRKSKEYENQELALEMAQRFGNLQDTIDILNKISSANNDIKMRSELRRKYGDHKSIIETLLEKKVARKESGIITLTDKGNRLKEYMKWHAKKIQSNLNKMLKTRPGKQLIYVNKKHSKKILSGKGKPKHSSVYLPDKKEWIKEIAIPETIVAAFKRTRQNNIDFHVTREDIYEKNSYSYRPLDICLLIDTSASMTGDRLKSAKFLAEYLVNNTCDRISVVVFQENDVEVIVPFTRNFNLVQRNLSKIDSKGLTPLALAIEKSLEYIESEKKKEILMMLITDGIPTVSNSSMDPVKDAINAARKIAEKNIYFSCIGLQPNKKHLEQIAKEGQGNLYIVDELRTDLLIHIANKEREAQ